MGLVRTGVEVGVRLGECEERWRQTSRTVIASRLLVLQSKRLMLSTLQGRIDRREVGAAPDRLEMLAEEARDAEGQYRSCVLKFGAPDSHDFWLVVYSQLIGVGSGLATKLRSGATELPAEERYEVSTEVEALEGMIEDWTAAMQATMTHAVA